MNTLTEVLSSSTLYNYYHQQNEEVLKHKWIESEKLGKDIGYDAALVDWIFKHQRDWKYKE